MAKLRPYQGIISSSLRQGDWRFFDGQRKLLVEADGIKPATFAAYTTKYYADMGLPIPKSLVAAI
jgi:hypothetical protein